MNPSFSLITVKLSFLNRSTVFVGPSGPVEQPRHTLADLQISLRLGHAGQLGQPPCEASSADIEVLRNVVEDLLSVKWRLLGPAGLSLEGDVHRVPDVLPVGLPNLGHHVALHVPDHSAVVGIRSLLGSSIVQFVGSVNLNIKRVKLKQAKRLKSGENRDKG